MYLKLANEIEELGEPILHELSAWLQDDSIKLSKRAKRIVKHAMRAGRGIHHLKKNIDTKNRARNDIGKSRQVMPHKANFCVLFMISLLYLPTRTKTVYLATWPSQDISHRQ